MELSIEEKLNDILAPWENCDCSDMGDRQYAVLRLASHVRNKVESAKAGIQNCKQRIKEEEMVRRGLEKELAAWESAVELLAGG